MEDILKGVFFMHMREGNGEGRGGGVGGVVFKRGEGRSVSGRYGKRERERKEEVIGIGRKRRGR